jgi:hypothetical protein
MITAKVTLDCDRIHDWSSFHDEFARVRTVGASRGW